MKEKCEEFDIPWDQYDQTATQMDNEAAAAGTDVNDEMDLDETLGY